jgi:hypothetical protein
MLMRMVIQSDADPYLLIAVKESNEDMSRDFHRREDGEHMR